MDRTSPLHPRTLRPRLPTALLGMAVIALVLTATAATLTPTLGTHASAVVVPSPGSAAGLRIEVSSQPSVTLWRIRVTESGLASGIPWYATCNGTTKHSTTTSATTSLITFQEPVGTYYWSILNVSGYTVSPQSGTVTITGGNQTVPVTFSSTSPHGTGLLAKYWWVAAAVGLIFLVILVLVIVRWRRHRNPPAAEWMPPAVESTDAGAPEGDPMTASPGDLPSGEATPPPPDPATSGPSP
jgi:hypothetical protein